MNKVLKVIAKWLGRIVLGLLGLVLLVLLLFFIFRGTIVTKAVKYFNTTQPGEVQLGKLHLRPFMHFPDVSLQLDDLLYTSVKADSTIKDSIPVLQIDEIYVSLDIIKLIKGTYEVSSIRLGDGVLNYSVGKDTVSNIERALGIRFGGGAEEKPDTAKPSVFTLDLEELQLRNLELNYSDSIGNMHVSTKINGLKSGISYGPEEIIADLMMHLEIISATIDNIILDKARSVSFTTSVFFDQPNEKIKLGESALALDNTLFEVAGDVDLGNKDLDVKFSAQNKGIDLLNFLLSGVLDIDAIEQIGEGEISFGGTISGSFANTLPLVKMNFSAKDLGFNVHAIGQKVTDIGFSGYASNGLFENFSGAEFNIDTFHVTFPDGELDGKVHVSNLVTPDVQFALNGKADLALLNEILVTDAIQNMKGSV
ncbi:hypothetical protein ACFLT1_09255, partial [Bacteroidota bacterium]